MCHCKTLKKSDSASSGSYSGSYTLPICELGVARSPRPPASVHSPLCSDLLSIATTSNPYVNNHFLCK
jgi:hypothetical protein